MSAEKKNLKTEMDPKVFKKELQNRISEGKEIRKKTVDRLSDMEYYEKKFNIWNNQNLDLFKKAFGEEENIHISRYKEAGEHQKLEIAKVGEQETLQDHYKIVRIKLNDKISELEDIFTKL
ncbi:MAG: hypothetical protein ACOC31_02580 [Bacteroidota bacterium]